MDLLYVGSKDGVEKKMAKDFGLKYRGVSCGKLRRYLSWANFRDMMKVPVGVLQALFILKKFKPDVIFSKGGYVSVPVAIAGWVLRVPVICHESDLRPGLANKICFKFAHKICVSFEESLDFVNKKKAVFTGNPVRNEVLKGSKQKGWEFSGFDGANPVILVMGGSQGARQINELVEASLSYLTKEYQILHVRGRGNLNIKLTHKNYKQYEYISDELADVYAISDLVVSRGGANSLAELGLLKKKAIILPLGMNVSRGDQIENATIFSRKFGWSILNEKAKSKDFIDAIELTMKTELLDGEIENGVDKIVELILKV